MEHSVRRTIVHDVAILVTSIVPTFKAVAHKLHGIGEGDEQTLAAVEGERSQLVPEVLVRAGRP